MIVKELVTHGDERGFFREIIRATDTFFAAGFGQWSHSLVRKGVLKAWHGHRYQTQWTYVATGLVRVAVHDAREDSPTAGRTEELLLGDGQVARVYSLPPGVVHGYRCLEEAHVFYVTSGTYDLDDEVRLPHDDAAIGYRWGGA
jgi:dTDP-4-dehydrorhamnose 3,5-epimerase